MNRRIVAILLSVVVVVTACSGDDDTSGFLADPAPIDPALAPALADDANAAAVPALQRNFLELCVEGAAADPPELEPVQEAGLVAVCGCTYDALVAEVRDRAEGADADERERAAYQEFRGLERDLRTGGDLDPTIEALVADCVRSEAGL